MSRGTLVFQVSASGVPKLPLNHDMTSQASPLLRCIALRAASQKEDDMPAWMLEDNQQQDQQAHQAQRLRKAKARAKTTLFGSSRHSPRKPPTGAKGLARAHARPPGAVAPDTGGLSTEDTEFLLDAWDSDFEDAAAKRKPSR